MTNFLTKIISFVKVTVTRVVLRMRTILRAYLDLRRCRKAEWDAFNDYHYGSGSHYRWQNACMMTTLARQAFYRTLPVWLQPKTKMTQAQQLMDLFEQVKAK